MGTAGSLLTLGELPRGIFSGLGSARRVLCGKPAPRIGTDAQADVVDICGYFDRCLWTKPERLWSRRNAAALPPECDDRESHRVASPVSLGTALRIRYSALFVRGGADLFLAARPMAGLGAIR